MPRPVRPAPDPAPDRRGDGRRGAVRDPRGGVPVLPARPRRDRDGPTGSSGRTRRAWRSPRTRRARRSRSGSCRAATRPTSGGRRRRTSRPPPRRSARSSPGSRRASTARPTTSSSTRAPLREQVDATYHWHWEIHPRLREIAGLELGTGLPVNPVSPEDAVEELLGRAERGVEVARVELRRARRPSGVTRGRVPPSLGRRARAPIATASREPSRSEYLVVADPPLADLREPARPPRARLATARRRHERRRGITTKRASSSRRCSPSTTARSTPTSCGCCASPSSRPT